MKCESLAEMGIRNPQEIIGYTLFTVHNKDVLRINYKRKKGSLLPVSKRFTFPRYQKLVPSDKAGEQSLLDEVSPMLLRAIEELDGLVKMKNNNESVKKALVEEIGYIEQELHARLNALKVMVDKLDCG